MDINILCVYVHVNFRVKFGFFAQNLALYRGEPRACGEFEAPERNPLVPASWAASEHSRAHILTSERVSLFVVAC